MRIRVEVKVPEFIIRSEFIKWQLARAQRLKTGPDVRGKFLKTVEGWKQTRPGFQITQSIGNDFVAIRIFTTSERYRFVNYGAKPHIIKPRRVGRLRFRPGYRSATMPRILKSSAPIRSGPYVSASLVRHPGFDARDFDIEVAEQSAQKFAKDMQEALNDAVRAR